MSTDHRSRLEAVRDRLTEELNEASGRDVASIARELRLTLAELESLPDAREESPVDDLSARREARRAAASGQ
jgi:hypothetical protein